MPRTAKDEYKYDEGLRRESDIKTEVIVHLHDENRFLLNNQKTLLMNLVVTTDTLVSTLQALNVYRKQLLERTTQIVENTSSHCASGCTKHEWDTKDGWKRDE